MSDKVITFGIAAYNCEKFLQKCLDSFITGDECDKLTEVIVVNDGSKDNTETIAKQYHEKYPDMFLVINKENGGHGSTINEAARIASGKYFKVIDADDWVDKRELKKYIKLLSETNADVVMTNYKTFDISDNKEVYHNITLKDSNKVFNLDEITANWNSVENGVTFHGVTYNTEFYKKYGTKLAEKVFYEDHQFATIPFCFARSVRVFDVCLYVYRIGDVNQSVSDANQYKRRNNLTAVITAMAQFYNDNAKKLSTAGKKYYMQKLGKLMLSYYTVVLQTADSYKRGRKEAVAFKKEMEGIIPDICEDIQKRYEILMLMNRLHISKKTYNSLLNCRLIKLLRGK